MDRGTQDSVQHTLTQSGEVSLRPILDGCCKMSQLDITRSFLTVNAGRKMIGEVVGVIVLAFIPVDANMFENIFVEKPMNFHVPCIGIIWIHAGIDKTISSGVVCL